MMALRKSDSPRQNVPRVTRNGESFGGIRSTFDKYREKSGPPVLTPGFTHEQVVFCHDAETGLRAIIALSTTALGPGLGGTRFYPYASTDAALADVLNLSSAMAYKNALAGLDHGGGKAAIIGDPATDKTPELLRAYGRFVESLSGRYVTASDVGTYVADMDVIAETTRFATGRSEAQGGAGDSSVLTALGVFQGMRAAVVCGAANNQLPREGVGGSADLLQDRGILYAPDFLVNSGGVIQVADELHGFDFERARARTERIYDTTRQVLTTAAERSETPEEAARHLAEERMAAASPGGMWLPGRPARR
jgi:glutamate dehydrogenase/leucine dehydrogenase